jgi:hypothetical protein
MRKLLALAARDQIFAVSDAAWRLRRSWWVVVASGSLLSGCASIVMDSAHPIKVETKTADGQIVNGATCALTNDRDDPDMSMTSGDSIKIRRSRRDLEITCQHPQNPDAKATAISRANAGMFGNVLLTSTLGLIIDHYRGTGYTYPTWVQLVFGKNLVFDRRSEQSGQPVGGTEAVAEAKN